MAQLNFPTSPTVNQTYTANGKTWLYDGQAWVVQGGAVNNAGIDPVIAALTFDVEPADTVSPPVQNVPFFTYTRSYSGTYDINWGKNSNRDGQIYQAIYAGDAPAFMKFDKDGSQLYFKKATVGEPLAESDYAISYPFADGSVVHAGAYYPNNGSNNRAWVYRLDENGNILWKKQRETSVATFGVSGDDATGDTWLFGYGSGGLISIVTKITKAGVISSYQFTANSNAVYTYAGIVKGDYIYITGEFFDGANWQSYVMKCNKADLSIVWKYQFTSSEYSGNPYGMHVSVDKNNNVYVWNDYRDALYSINQSGTLRYAVRSDALYQRYYAVSVNDDGVASLSTDYSYNDNRTILINPDGTQRANFNLQSYAVDPLYNYGLYGTYICGVTLDNEFVYFTGYERIFWSGTSNRYQPFTGKLPINYFDTNQNGVCVGQSIHHFTPSYFLQINNANSGDYPIYDIASTITVSAAPDMTLNTYTETMANDTITLVDLPINYDFKEVTNAFG